MVEAQKKWIEITQQQNALVMKAIEEGISPSQAKGLTSSLPRVANANQPRARGKLSALVWEYEIAN